MAGFMSKYGGSSLVVVNKDLELLALKCGKVT